jgi:hypothetical protein
MESLLRDEEVWSASLESRLKRAITFNPTVGSRSKFYKGFQRLFSLGYLWNCYVMMKRSSQPYLSIGSKRDITFDSIVVSHSQFYVGFQRLFSLG